MEVQRRSQMARAREAVARMSDAGMSFGAVEDVIELLALPDEQKTALWMLAWSRLSGADQGELAEVAWARGGGNRPLTIAPR